MERIKIEESAEEVRYWGVREYKLPKVLTKFVSDAMKAYMQLELTDVIILTTDRSEEEVLKNHLVSWARHITLEDEVRSAIIRYADEAREENEDVTKIDTIVSIELYHKHKPNVSLIVNYDMSELIHAWTSEEVEPLVHVDVEDMVDLNDTIVNIGVTNPIEGLAVGATQLYFTESAQRDISDMLSHEAYTCEDAGVGIAMDIITLLQAQFPGVTHVVIPSGMIITPMLRVGLQVLGYIPMYLTYGESGKPYSLVFADSHFPGCVANEVYYLIEDHDTLDDSDEYFLGRYRRIAKQMNL